MVAADAQAFWHDLGRQMPIAEMPGNSHQMQRIVTADFEQRLGRRDYLDQAAVFQYQRIAAAQCDRVFQIEQEFEAACANHRHPPPVPIVEIEHHGVGGGLLPAMLAQNACCTHDNLSSFDAFSLRELIPTSLENAMSGSSPPCRR